MLIVEDDKKAIETAENFFSNKYEVSVARDLKEALELISEHTFDYIITDTFYPQETGTGKRDYVKMIAESIIKEVKEMVEIKHLANWCLDASIKGCQAWLDDSDEANQPMGLWLIKILLEEKGFDSENILLTTNMDHHAQLFEPINCAMEEVFPLTRELWLEWPRLYECQDLEGKHKKEFWERVQEWLDR